MTTTMEWLEGHSFGNLALSFVIEGLPTVFSTADLANTYSADVAPYDQFDDPVGQLMVKGTIGEAIQLYAQDIKPTELEFTIVDRQETIAGTLFREAYSSGHRTYLTTSVLAGATGAVTVMSTSGFAASGTIYIGDEAITYTTTTATTFAGTIGRAQYVINQTHGGTAFSPTHAIGNNVTTSATTAPAVTDYPKTFYGRFVHLFVHYKDPLTGQYSLPSDSYKVWSGRIESYRDEGDGKCTIVAKSAMALLSRAIGSEQWTGRFNEGFILTSAEDTLYIVNTASPSYSSTASLGFTGARVTHDRLAQIIQTQFETWRAAGTGSGGSRSGDLWELALYEPNNGAPARYRFRLNANTVAITGGAYPAISMNERMWELLGWNPDVGTPITTSGEMNRHRKLERVSDNVWELHAEESPIVYYDQSLKTADRFFATSQVGTFVTQTVSDMGVTFSPDVNGVIKMMGGSFDGNLYSVKFTAGDPAEIRIYARLDPGTGRFRLSGDTVEQNKYVRLGDTTQPPTVKQVWFEHGAASDVLLKALLSTGGASGYNHSSFDAITTIGFGISVPGSLVDIESWLDLDDVVIMFVISEPRPFYDYLEPVLQCTNRYVVWKADSATGQPKLTIVRPTLDNSASVTWALTESNKCMGRNGPDRIKVERAADGIINRVVVKYGYAIDGSGSAAKIWHVEDIASQSDYGRRRTVTIDAPGIVNVPEIAPAAIGPALAYCSRPLAVAERSYNASLMRMAPGDAVSVTDNYMIDPTTGSRGGVVYGWVLATQFDLATGQGRARIVFLPEKVPRVMKFSPSARVAIGFFGGSDYDAGTKTLTVEEHEFSGTGELADARNFANGDAVHIFSIDESSPLEWTDVVSGTPTNTTITLVTGLAGFDGAKRYIVEADTITAVQSGQRNDKAFIADDATLSTGHAVPTPYDWGQERISSVFFTRDYSTGMFEPNSSYDDQGEPMSAHKIHYLTKAASNLHSYKTRNVYINTYFRTAATQTGTTPELVYIGYIPVYGHVASTGCRALVARLFGLTSSGTATFRLRTTPVRPEGSSFTTHTYPASSNSVDFATTSTTLVWSSELTLLCAAVPTASENAQYGTWICIEIFGSAGGVTATLRGVFVAEKEILT